MPKIRVQYKVVHKTDEVFTVKQVKRVVETLHDALPIVQEALQSNGLQRLTVEEVKDKKPVAPKAEVKK